MFEKMNKKLTINSDTFIWTKREVGLIYNAGNGHCFFEENVFINQNDILETKLSKREIFAHQAVNTNFFGTLTILPNGEVYSNLNCKPIGAINDSIYDLIITELDKNYSWRLLRNQKPCTDCLFQWLCPSLSNYELVIERINLCNINYLR
jgi:pseudo-rSAM protein